MITTLILPGLYDSGPEHWQSHWERVDPHCRRVVQADWDTPRCADWVATLDAAIAAHDGPVVLAAHSAACAMVAHWARDAAPDRRARVRGALLVAPSDPAGPRYPVGPTGFAPMPRQPLPFPGIVVASPDDEYVTPETARAYADAWGSRYVQLAPCGHVNSASGLGMWPTGYALLEELRATPARVPSCRAMRAEETDAVAAFARRVYDEAIAPHESPEGRATYARYASPDAMRARAVNHAVTVAEEGTEPAGVLVGVLEVRDSTHVSMLFVDPRRQRAGVARALLAHAFGQPSAWPALTVNSTPHAVGAYARLGFVAEDGGAVVERNGLRFVPMRRPAGIAAGGADGTPGVP